MAKAKGNRALIVVSVIVYLACLVVLTPLNVVYRMLEPINLPVEVMAVSGTLWEGKVVVKHNLTGQLTGTWNLQLSSLLAGNVAAHLDVDSSLVELNSRVSLNAFSQQMQLEDTSGFISAQLVNQIAAQSKTQISGDLELNKANIQYNLVTGESDAASGQLVWMGGQVKYPKGRAMASANLPMLVAKLNSENKELQASVSTVEGLEVATASLKEDGWANVAVRKAMIDLVGEKWPSQVSPDTIVFEISERVFAR